MKHALIILALCWDSAPLLAGVESIGGNGRLTIPSGWIVDQRSPIFIARTSDYAVSVTAFANPIPHPGIWILQTSQKNAIIQAQWDSRVLESLQGFFQQGLPILDLDRGNVAFGSEDDMYVGRGTYTIDWSDFSFSYETRAYHLIAYDAGHVYSVNTSAGGFATTTQRRQSLDIVDSLVSSNTFDAAADNDGDGLRGDWEFVQGSSDFDTDSDDDGLPDAVESDLGTNLALNQLPLLKSLIIAYPQAFDGVFTTDQVQNGSLGDLFVEVNDGTALLTLDVLESDDLVTWSKTTQVQANVPVSGSAKFFRFEVK